MLRMIVIWIVVLPVIHWIVARYSRSVRREELERDFDDGNETGTREDFIARGMAEYEHSLRRKVIVLVYVLPILALGVIIWAVNRN